MSSYFIRGIGQRGQKKRPEFRVWEGFPCANPLCPPTPLETSDIVQVLPCPSIILFFFVFCFLFSLTLSFLSLFFWKTARKTTKKTRILHSYRTPKIPGKEGKNAQKNKEILAGKKNKEFQQKARKGRTWGEDLVSFFFVCVCFWGWLFFSKSPSIKIWEPWFFMWGCLLPLPSDTKLLLTKRFSKISICKQLRISRVILCKKKSRARKTWNANRELRGWQKRGCRDRCQERPEKGAQTVN